MKISWSAVCMSLLLLFSAQAALADASLLTTGINLFFQHDYDDSVRYLHQYVEAHPNDVTGRYYLTLCDEKLKWVSCARDQFAWLAMHCHDKAKIEEAKLGLMALEKEKGAAPEIMQFQRSLDFVNDTTNATLARIAHERQDEIIALQMRLGPNFRSNPEYSSALALIDNQYQQATASVLATSQARAFEIKRSFQPTLAWLNYVAHTGLDTP